MYYTEVYDTYIDGPDAKRPPAMEHETRKAAIDYANAVFARRKCVIKIWDNPHASEPVLILQDEESYAKPGSRREPVAA